jgi:hypothetical protein
MAVDSIIAGLKAFILTWDELADGRPLWVDYMGVNPKGYSIVPQPGNKILSEDILGGSEREYLFALQSSESTSDDLERIASVEFFEAFGLWLEAKTKAGEFPEMPSNMHPTLIETVQWAYFSEEGQSETGVYMVQCRIEYDQDPT